MMRAETRELLTANRWTIGSDVFAYAKLGHGVELRLSPLGTAEALDVTDFAQLWLYVCGTAVVGHSGKLARLAVSGLSLTAFNYATTTETL